LSPEVSPTDSSQPFDTDVHRQIFFCLNLAACLAAGCLVSRGSFFGPTQHLAMPPGRHGFLGVLPSPGALRPPVRCPSDPCSSDPRKHEPACASYPASSPSVSIRLALRHFLRRLLRACRSPFAPCGISGYARTVHLHFPRGSAELHYIVRSWADSSRFLLNRCPAATIQPFGIHCLRQSAPRPACTARA